MSLLEVHGLRAGYDGVDILHGVDFRVAEGEIVAIIGPNGAGKSTAMKALAGLVAVGAGRIVFEGEDITGLRTDHITRRGIGYVPQEENVFPSLTVRENLEMGAYIAKDDPGPRIAAVFELFPPLEEKARRPVRELSGGLRQRVAIGRALMLEPRLLLLDEPTAGLSPRFVGEIFERIRSVNARGVAVLMVEQNAKKALALVDRGYVLAMGANRYEDTGAGLLANREVARMFLGG